MVMLRISSGLSLGEVLLVLQKYRDKTGLVKGRKELAKGRKGEGGRMGYTKGGKGVMQVVNPSVVISERHADIAHYFTADSFKRGYSKSRTMHNEFLMWLTGEQHMGKAIESGGAKDARDMFLFSSHPIPKSLLEELHAKKLNLRFTRNKTKEENALERMAWMKAQRILHVE